MSKTTIDYKEEIWKPVTEWEDRYSISSYGRVKNRYNRIVKGYVDNLGYYSVMLYRDYAFKHKKIHRLVAAEFIGKSDLTVNHIDRNPSNNYFKNLEYVTHRENHNHWKIHEGRKLVGSCKCNKGYQGRIMVNGKYEFLGLFNTREEAHAAYLRRAKEIGETRYLTE